MCARVCVYVCECVSVCLCVKFSSYCSTHKYMACNAIYLSIFFQALAAVFVPIFASSCSEPFQAFSCSARVSRTVPYDRA